MIKLKLFFYMLLLSFWVYSMDLDEEIINNLEFVESMDMIEKSEEHELKNLSSDKILKFIEVENNGDST